MRYARTVVAYHGCDLDVARGLLAGETFKPSVNDYDWLGAGIYFWEHGADRAYRWAQNQQALGKVREPAVIGALVQLGDCFDLLDTRSTGDLAAAYPGWETRVTALGLPMPKNTGKLPVFGLRRRDCAVLNWYLEICEETGQRYDTVRCCFIEGEPVFPTSGIFRESHIQIAVRNPACILGVFRPTLEA